MSVAVLVVALAATACGSSGSKKSGAGGTAPVGRAGTLIVASPADIQSLDPGNPDGKQVGLTSRAVTNGNVFEALLRREVDGTITPKLATALPTQQPDKSWRFTLRKGVKFSNGEAFNADTVVYNVERIISKKYNSGLSDFFVTITGAKKVDDYTVDITTDGFDSVLPSRMALLYMVPPIAAAKAGFGQKPIGTGPYAYAGRTVNGVALTVNTKYWGKQPTIKRVEIRTIADDTTRIAALKAGEVDLIYNLPPDLTDGIPKVAHVQGPENPIVVLNSYAGITQDVRVRKALNLAVDRQSIADNLFAGYAQPSKCQMVPPASTGYDDSLTPYPYDLNQAKQLIDEAGAKGKSMVLYTSSYFTNGKEIGEILAAAWEKLGIKVDLRNVELQTYINEATVPKGAAGPEAVYVSTSDELFDATRSLASYLATDSQRGRASNPDVDAAFAEASKLPDGAERDAALARAAKAACDNAAVDFLLTTEDVWGVGKNINFTPRPDGELNVSDISKS